MFIYIYVCKSVFLPVYLCFVLPWLIYVSVRVYIYLYIYLYMHMYYNMYLHLFIYLFDFSIHSSLGLLSMEVLRMFARASVGFWPSWLHRRLSGAVCSSVLLQTLGPRTLLARVLFWSSRVPARFCAEIRRYPQTGSTSQATYYLPTDLPTYIHILHT